MVQVKKHLVVFLMYFLFFGALYADVLFGGRSLISGDIFAGFHPMLHFSVNTLKQGIVPLWNSHNSFGVPFLANPQACVFYPPSLLMYLPDFTLGFNLYTVLHLVMACFFTYLWMREWGVSVKAAVLSGFAFGLSGYVTSMVGGTIVLCAVSYFPLALWSFRRAQKPGLLWKAVTAFVLALQYLAGDPAPCFASFFLFSLITLGKDLRQSLISRRPDLRSASAFSWIAVIFAGLTCFQTLLFAQFVYLSDRLHTTLANRLSNSLPPCDLWGLVVPRFTGIQAVYHDFTSYQSWLQNTFIGVGVAILALCTVFRIRDREVRLHWVLAALGLALAMGKYSPVYLFFHHYYPLFGLFRYPVRFMFFFHFSAACLAGFGFDYLGSSVQNERSRSLSLGSLTAGIGIVLLAAATVLFVLHFSELRGIVWEWTTRHYAPIAKPVHAHSLGVQEAVKALLIDTRASLIIAVWASAAIFVSLNSRRFGRVAQGVLFVIVLADLLRIGATLPRIDSKQLSEPTANLKIVLKDGGLFRVAFSPLMARRIDEDRELGSGAAFLAHREMLTQGMMLYFGIDEVFGYDSLFVREAYAIHDQLFSMAYAQQSRFFDLLNVRYLSSPVSELGPPFEKVYSGAEANLFLNHNALPRAFLVEKAVKVQNFQEALDRLTSLDFDPLKELLLEEESPYALGSPKGENELKIKEYSMNQARMSARVSDKPWLFFSDTYYPGWKAFVDGKPVKIYKANVAFKALRLSPGAHDIIWRYDPWLFKVGAAVSLLSLAALLSALGLGALRAQSRGV